MTTCQELTTLRCTILHWWSVAYDIALDECGVRYCPGGVWCTIWLCGSVVYDVALEELWCTIVP